MDQPSPKSTHKDSGPSGDPAPEHSGEVVGDHTGARSMGEQGTDDLPEQLVKAEASLREAESRLRQQKETIFSLQQKLEIRNLSLERLQAQFTTAADAVNRLLNERQLIRNSRWMRLGRMLGLGPTIGDDLP